MKLKTILFVIGILYTLHGSAQEINKNLSEKERIEALIKVVENLQNAQFYRNGSLYSAKLAAEHLRLKVTKID